MVPFLKGMHLTLDSWRPFRDEEGWKWNEKEIREHVRNHKGDELATQEAPPKRVKVVPRMLDDMQALKMLTAAISPPKRRVRSKLVVEIFYGFGDASATGACVNFQKVVKKGAMFQLDNRIHYRYGHCKPGFVHESCQQLI